MNRETLKKKFEDVGIAVKMLKEPFLSGRPGAAAVFGMRVGRKVGGNSRHEWFDIFLPEDALVDVACSDKKSGQVVLSVKEPRREFFVPVPSHDIRNAKKNTDPNKNWQHTLIAQLQKQNPNLKHNDILFNGSSVNIRNWTRASAQHYLAGMDERQLFIAELSKPATSMKQAYDLLKPNGVTLAEGKRKVIRQGEWFFLELTPEEKASVELYTKKKLAIIHRKKNIGEVIAGRRIGGNPHVVDEMIAFDPPRLEHGFSVRPRSDFFCRGKVRHRDHETVELKTWMRVIRNTEANAGGMFTSDGIRFID